MKPVAVFRMIVIQTGFTVLEGEHKRKHTRCGKISSTVF